MGDDEKKVGAADHKKRTSLSPVIEKKDIDADVDKELKNAMTDFQTWDDNQQSLVRAVLRGKIYDKVEYKKKYHAVRDERRDLRKEMMSLKIELDVCRSQLSVRPHVEILQRKVIPAWLLNSSVKPALQWIISVEYELTLFAKVLRGRLENMASYVTVEDLGYAFTEFYDVTSEVLNHDKTPRNINLGEEDWKKLFEKLCFHTHEKQDAIRTMLKPIDQVELDLASKSCSKEDYLIYMNLNNICIQLTIDFEDESTHKITQYCGKFMGQVLHFYYPKHRDGKFIGSVYFVFENTNVQEVHELRNTLKAYRKNPAEDLSFIYNKITFK